MNKEQVELIQREIDGANTPDDSARVRALVAADPEAQALLAELNQVARTFERVGERTPSPQLKQAILAALQTPRSQTPNRIGRWLTDVLQSTTERMEELVMTKKTILIGATAVAVVIVGAYVVTGYPRLGGTAGTIGDSISGVQPAARYHGRTLTQADVTLDNPQIAALFQNHEVLNLVKSDAFRDVVKNDAFLRLQQNAAFRGILATRAFHNVMQSDAFRDAVKRDASRDAQSTQAWRELHANASFQALEANQTFRAMQSDASFQALMASNAFQTVMASQAMQSLQASQLFRDVAQNAQLSQLFLSEANRFQQ